MATLVLSAAGSAVGSTVGGSVLGLSGAAIGQAIGATVGSVLDQSLLGQGAQAVSHGKVDTLRIQGAAEGASVPRVYGKMRVAGQVVWATRFLEQAATIGGDGGKAATPQVTEYSYSISLALALCEGEILRIGRVWADGNLISLEGVNWRLHRGTEDQEPDDLIVSVEGAENAPAYRGTAYLVFENLQLGPFGNRIPQFNVEVIRRAAPSGDGAGLDPYEEIRSVALVPGTGEYSLATTPVVYDYGLLSSGYANVNNTFGTTDLELSLEHLFTEVPNTESVALVVSWFGDDLRCGRCQVYPAVEQNAHEGAPLVWSVAGQSRTEARVVGQLNGRPVYGGTPSDQTVVQSIQEIHRRGGEVMFYPFILMDVPSVNGLSDPWSDATDQPAFPWRGRITLDVAPGREGTTDKTAAAAADVSAFFGTAEPGDFSLNGTTVAYTGPDEWSLRRFILHSAYLCRAAGGVASFCIGSELRSLTQIRSAEDRFPAVEALISLARDVRAVLGPNTKISYAADWSEYFGYHANDGTGDVYFHLDPLWASSDIDFIGIDNYMPLSDWRDDVGHADEDAGEIYNLDYLSANVVGGEGFDWYYASSADRDAQNRSPIEDTAYGEHWVFRYKDLKNWWSLRHHNRPGGLRNALPTEWSPRSKPIWFTELGCAAIDKATNQPNVFLDVKSSESNVPYFSSGTRDDFVQYRFFQAHYAYWADPVRNPVSPSYGGSMVDMSRAHIWAWDARPWPDFPDRLQTWSDGENYARGHWISGRTGIATVASIVADVSERADFLDYDVRALSGAVQGYLISSPEAPRQSIQPLMLSSGFDAVEEDGAIAFRPRRGRDIFDIPAESLIEDRDGNTATFGRSPAKEVPDQVQISFFQSENDYQRGASSAGAAAADDSSLSRTELPIAMSADEGSAVAARWLSETQVARDTVTLTVPQSMVSLTVGEVIRLENGAASGTYRIDRIEDAGGRRITATRVDPGVYVPGRPASERGAQTTFTLPGPVYVEVLDLPLLSDSDVGHAPYIAAAGSPWTGRVAVYRSNSDSGYLRDQDISAPTSVGTTSSDFSAATPGLWAWGQKLRLVLETGTLESRSAGDVLNGANRAAVRGVGATDWEVLQFQTANLVDNRTYELDGFLRGQAGTVPFMAETLPSGSTFILLNGAQVQPSLSEDARGLDRHYRVGPASVSYSDPSYVHIVDDTSAIGLRPYAPAHISTLRLPDGGLLVRWIRQTRIGGDSWLGIDVPLSEMDETYRLEVSVGGVVRRSVKVDGPSFVYSSADQVSDGFGSSAEIAVAQISEAFGPGPFKRIIFDG